MGLDQSADKPGFWDLVNQIYTQHGMVVLVLVLFLGFTCFLIWKLIWKVWSNAMKAKDEEIARLSKERDKYQAMVFDRLRSSQIIVLETEEKSLAEVRRDPENT